MVDFFNNFEPYTDSLANDKDQRIIITHVPSDQTVVFKAFLTQFEDRYKSDWEDEDVYGRMDPISTFVRTRRSISLGWDVPAASIEEAQRNLVHTSRLIQFLYPVYEPVPGNNIINTSPLLRIKFMNWVQNTDPQQTTENITGLLGKVNGFTYAPDLEAGAFDPMPQARTPEEGGRLIANLNNFEAFPKLIKFACEFTVFHEHPLGWSQDGFPDPDFTQFPYQNNNIREIFDRGLTGQPQNPGQQGSSAADRSNQRATEQILLPNNGDNIA